MELYHEAEAIAARLRRLHLVIVDLCHPRKTATRTEKQFYQQITQLRDARGVGYGMPGVSALHRYRFATRKNGDATMSLAIVSTTLTNRYSCYGQREPETMVFGSSMSPGTSTTTFVRLLASAIWVWSTFMQLLA